MKYLREFIIGASFPVAVLFYIMVYDKIQEVRNLDPEYYKSLPEKETPFFLDVIVRKLWPKKYKYNTYFWYSNMVPLFFGILNIISLIIAEHFGLTLRNRFVVIGITSWLFMMVRQTINNTYNFKTKDQFMTYYIKMFILYMFIWNVVIYNLEKHM